MSDFQQRVFGKYTLLERIAVGGMAEIFKAKTQGYGGFEKMLAIKRLHPQFSDDHTFVKMLVDEARIAVLLQHSNVVQVFDLGRIGRHYYIAMEFIEGRDLFQLLRTLHQEKALMPIDAAAFAVAEVCQGLHYAHTKIHPLTRKPLHIVHRDVSPQNVLLSWAGEVKLADFGIVKADQRATVTQAGVIKGKFYYMSPEQARGEIVDARSDIFSTGIVLFEALTARPLYEDAESATLLDQVQAGPTQSPQQLRKEIPDELEAICMRALEVDKRKRYQSSLEFSRALSSFLVTSGTVFTKADMGEYLLRLYAGTEEENLAVAMTEEVVVEDTSNTITDVDLPGKLSTTRDTSPPCAADPPSTTEFNERTTDHGKQKSDVITSSDMPVISADQAPDTESPAADPLPVSVAMTNKIPRIAIRNARRADAQSSDDGDIQRSKTGLVRSFSRPGVRANSAMQSEMLTPIPSARYTRLFEIERRLRLALGVVLAAIAGVSIAIIYLLLAPIELPEADALKQATQPAAVASPVPDTSEETATSGPDLTLVNGATAGAALAQLRIITRRPNQRFRLYINGKLATVKDGVVAIEAGRHTIRALLRPEGSWTKDQVIEVDSGAKVTVSL